MKVPAPPLPPVPNRAPTRPPTPAGAANGGMAAIQRKPAVPPAAVGSVNAGMTALQRKPAAPVPNNVAPALRQPIQPRIAPLPRPVPAPRAVPPAHRPGGQPVQLFSWWRATPLSTIGNVAVDRSRESVKDIWDVRRWRFNPLNIIAGTRNMAEETATGTNYHSSSRHGAHNTTGNSRARLTKSTMVNQYTGAIVKTAKAQGRFNSEAWEDFSWRRAKALFAGSTGGVAVTWAASRAAAETAASAAGGAPPYPASLSCSFKLSHNGSDVGISQTPGAADVSVSGVQVAVNYFPDGGVIYAWNGQMYPRALTPAQVAAAVAGPAASLAALNNSVRDIPYERLGLW